jgi:hypothetical protein
VKDLGGNCVDLVRRLRLSSLPIGFQVNDFCFDDASRPLTADEQVGLEEGNDI